MRCSNTVGCPLLLLRKETAYRDPLHRDSPTVDDIAARHGLRDLPDADYPARFDDFWFAALVVAGTFAACLVAVAIAVRP